MKPKPQGAGEKRVIYSFGHLTIESLSGHFNDSMTKSLIVNSEFES